jgi:hypothetical protein
MSMEVWKFIKASFQRANRNWRLLIVQFIAGIIMVPVLLLGIGIPALVIIVPAAQGGYDAEDFISFITDFESLIFILLGILIFLIFVLVILLIWAFIAGGVRASLLDDITEQKEFKLGTFMKQCRRFFGRIVGLWSTIGLIYMGVLVIFGGIAAVIIVFSVNLYETAEAGAVLLAILGGGFIFLILTVFGILVGIFTAIANTYLIAEDAQVGETIRGTFRFIRAFPGHTFLIILILFAIGFAAGMTYAIVTMPLTMIPYIGGLFSLMLSPVQMAMNLYLSLFGTTAYLLFYLWKKERIGSDYGMITSPKKTK